MNLMYQAIKASEAIEKERRAVQNNLVIAEDRSSAEDDFSGSNRSSDLVESFPIKKNAPWINQ